jgi:RHS repeat-associated protein
VDDIIIRDRDTDNDGVFDEAGAVSMARVSLSSGGVQADGHSRFAAISADGRYVAFESDATNLVSGDTNGYSDIFLRDRQTNQTVRVSLSAAGAQANGPSSQPAISGDGTVVIFQSDATNLVGSDTNGASDIFAYDKVPVRPTATPTLTASNTPSIMPTPSRTPTITPTALPGHSQQSIAYSYDPLYRLTAAEYGDGGYFRYSYDAVGNRLSEASNFGDNTYTYDIANRLTSVNGVNYTWDANGNLLSDGVSTYTYDTANRLASITAGASTTSYAYNGTGDRLGQTVNGTPTNYTLDLNAGLTQVLADGTNVYLYGNGRIGEQQPGGFVYHLPDALGSVRQLATAAGAPSLSQTFKPFGERMTSGGSGASNYGFTGEWQQGGLVYLRARYYASGQGRFTTRDPWPGDTSRPHSFNAWSYALSNPVTYADPSGHDPWWDEGDVPCWNGQSDTIYRYCILYRGGFLDAVHFKGARAYANINDPLSIWGSVYNARNKAEKHYMRYRTGIVNRVVLQQYYVVER